MKAILVIVFLHFSIQGFSQRIFAENLKFAVKKKHIPENIDSCMSQLDRMLADSTKRKIENNDEQSFVSDAHFGLGLWIRNNWRLWTHRKLTKYFNSFGIFHPDDMSSIILVSYHRHLSNRPINFVQQITFYKDYWNKRREK